jgi:histidyl-tRNA synthetase
MKIEPRTLKGFRDFLPKDARKRQYVLETLKRVFESYGFEPLETPALEYEDILTGKYGTEGDKLMYRFTDNGERKVAMRYDQTVPLARVVAQYQNELSVPFKRYQIQNVWRAENTQKGRYREFLQVDADIVGSYSPLADGEVIAMVVKCLEKLGFSAQSGSPSGGKNFQILINDRSVFTKLVDDGILTEAEMPKIVRAIDKIKKIGDEGVIEEIMSEGFTKEKATEILKTIKAQEKTDALEDISIYLENLNLDKKIIKYDPTLARGLDYYTGLIFEVEIEGYEVGSIAGGGRYDNLIGMFAGREIPAVGFAFGFDRLVETMEIMNLFPTNLYTSIALVAFATPELQEKALKIADELRNKKINCEVYPEDVNLEKQLKYADKKQIPFVVIVDENKLVLKNMNERTQEELTLDQILKQIL